MRLRCMAQCNHLPCSNDSGSAEVIVFRQVKITTGDLKLLCVRWRNDVSPTFLESIHLFEMDTAVTQHVSNMGDADDPLVLGHHRTAIAKHHCHSLLCTGLTTL